MSKACVADKNRTSSGSETRHVLGDDMYRPRAMYRIAKIEGKKTRGSFGRFKEALDSFRLDERKGSQERYLQAVLNFSLQSKATVAVKSATLKG